MFVKIEARPRSHQKEKRLNAPYRIGERVVREASNSEKLQKMFFSANGYDG